MNLANHADRLNLASLRTDLPPLILMSDVARLPDPVPAAVRLPPESAVMARHVDAASRRALVERLAPICRARNLRLIVADDLRLAADIGAFGLHLPERAAVDPAALAVRRAWRGPMFTIAAHSPDTLRRAAVLGADAALLSPVFATASHPERAPIGVLRFFAWCRSAAVPVYALGGVTPANVGRLAGRNIVGIAGIGGLA